MNRQNRVSDRPARSWITVQAVKVRIFRDVDSYATLKVRFCREVTIGEPEVLTVER